MPYRESVRDRIVLTSNQKLEDGKKDELFCKRWLKGRGLDG